MLRAARLPRAEHLRIEPQLASLALLETAASVTILALAAAYPELADEHIDRDESPEAWAAINVVDLARAITITIDRYRRLLAQRQKREREQVALLPF